LVGQPFQSRQGRRRIAGRRKPPVKAHTDPLPPWRGGGFAPPGLMKDGMGVPPGGCHPRPGVWTFLMLVDVFSWPSSHTSSHTSSFGRLWSISPNSNRAASMRFGPAVPLRGLSVRHPAYPCACKAPHTFLPGPPRFRLSRTDSASRQTHNARWLQQCSTPDSCRHDPPGVTGASRVWALRASRETIA
jgi:hypothetical protein